MMPMIRERDVPRFAAAWLFVFALLACSRSAAAQSVPSTADNSAATQDSPDKKADTPAAFAPALAPTQPKKPRVITNDDIKADRIGHNLGFAGGRNLRESAGNGDCDDECADQAREMAGFDGDDQEGDWRFALAAARRNLATDRAWPGAYATLARAVKTYCTFQQQVQQAAVPTGNDYSSRVERAKRERYVEDMTRVLRQTIDRANAQIEQMAQQADDAEEPARSAILRVLAQRAIDSCP